MKVLVAVDFEALVGTQIDVLAHLELCHLINVINVLATYHEQGMSSSLRCVLYFITCEEDHVVLHAICIISFHHMSSIIHVTIMCCLSCDVYLAKYSVGRDVGTSTNSMA